MFVVNVFQFLARKFAKPNAFYKMHTNSAFYSHLRLCQPCAALVFMSVWLCVGVCVCGQFSVGNRAYYGDYPRTSLSRQPVTHQLLLRALPLPCKVFAVLCQLPPLGRHSIGIQLALKGPFALSFHSSQMALNRIEWNGKNAIEFSLNEPSFRFRTLFSRGVHTLYANMSALLWAIFMRGGLLCPL